MSNDTIASTESAKMPKMDTVTAVKCADCGKIHDMNGDSFVSVMGDILIGMKGGLIGHNLDNDMRCMNISIFCRGRCFSRAVRSATQSVDDRPAYRRSSDLSDLPGIDSVTSMDSLVKET